MHIGNTALAMSKMDDSEHVCPLCCEELDLSDREFYPCKCGYQVCMWCWHRIREQETGLCPACRTPYGEDPHQFTALDVEEVLKANKEAQAAAKRERQHQQHIHNNHILSNGDADAGGDQSGGNGAMEIPKDRMQLANMRVIRRNLVYAVGLPSSIANEEVLKKPEYIGQYGKIAKIVLNRSQVVAEGGDPRRASASAYVTFQHKEDTLACILALDGFFLDGRNIRASYGTSKYCSAFIKNVRCNNPECTYLHEMGAAEDTFTKQEIQAGYVTSGRDVLARQQQILAEQLLQQQQSASGGYHVQPRKRIGGGGPSGTGKASAHPVFPAPEFDEPAKQGPPMVPAPVGMTRSVTTQATMTPSAAQQAALLNPATISAKLGRSASVGTSSRGPATAPSAHRKSQTAVSSSAALAAAATTAASVVAGGRSKDSSEGHPAPQSALSALTPLKRSTVKTVAPSKPAAVEEKLPVVRNGKKQNGVRAAAAAAAAVSAKTQPATKAAHSTSSIGGDVIGPPLAIRGNPASAIGPGRIAEPVSGVSSLGGHTIPNLSGSSSSIHSSAATLLGGDVFTGSLPGQNYSSSSVVGSSLLGGAPLTSSAVSAGDGPVLRGGNPVLWSGGSAPGPSVGGTGVIGSHISTNAGGSNSTSALASILGINLPTGSGSLRESSSTDLWSSSTPAPQGPSPLSTLNGSSMPQHHHPSNLGMMGGQQQSMNTGNSLIGGVPIGGQSSFRGGPGAIGAGSGGNSNSSDIALLQSLLPGVHITSDASTMGYGGGNPGWSGGDPLNSGGWTGGGGSRMQPTPGSAVGAIGQSNGQQNQGQGPGLW